MNEQNTVETNEVVKKINWNKVGKIAKGAGLVLLTGGLIAVVVGAVHAVKANSQNQDDDDEDYTDSDVYSDDEE